MARIYETSYVRVEDNDKEVSFKNIIECIKEYSSTKSDIDAFIFVSTDGDRQSVTWKALYEKSCAAARAIIRLGVKRKEIVAVNLRSCPEWLYATFGSMIAGAIPMSISFTYSDGSDLVATMEKLQCCSLLIMDPGFDNVYWNILQNLLDHHDVTGAVKSTKLPYLRYLLGVGFENASGNVKDFRGSFLDDTSVDVNFANIESDDVATFLQTSGSTGIPKLVIHTHGTLLSASGTNLIGFDSNHKIFNDRPFTWIGGYPFSVMTGQTRVTVSGFCDAPTDRVAFMKDVILKEGCTLTVGLPPLMAELKRTQDDLPSDWPVKGILTGGQPMTKCLASCIGKACKFLCCIYGSSEVIFLTQFLVENETDLTEYACGTALKLKGLEMRIVDENGQTLPVNTRGEIYVKTPGMFKGYLNDPEKTKAVMTPDGWYKSDDIGRITENGLFFVEGRKSNMIISGGLNVAPEILEQVIKTFPGVETAVIVPVPDDVYYQVVCACVVRKPGSDLTEEMLRKVCEDFHADKPGLFTVLPKFYMFIDKLPETNTGKIDRQAIVKVACDKFK